MFQLIETGLENMKYTAHASYITWLTPFFWKWLLLFRKTYASSHMVNSFQILKMKYENMKYVMRWSCIVFILYLPKYSDRGFTA